MNIINETLKTENFSGDYPFLNKHIIENGDSVGSRVGNTMELLDSKVTLTNPYKRCVGNNERDINVFFLIAEALWIFSGRKDVKFLEMFNSRMKTFSDNGEVFHAPYGFRLRSFGVASEDEYKPTNEQENHHAQQMMEGVDQIKLALGMLADNPDTRRVVMQIWNADFDLATISKDLPCNDLVMLKIRNNKLITTIANRSNDLHWGLPTNIFQFSFISEIMVNILGIKLGTQTHNSQSLHVYTDNPITYKMYDNIQITGGKFNDLYDNAIPFEMDFNFRNKSVAGKLNEVDKMINWMLFAVENDGMSEDREQELYRFSGCFYLLYRLMMLYKNYKFNSDKSDLAKLKAISVINEIALTHPKYDILSLAQNFFYSKLSEGEQNNVLIKRNLINHSKL